MGGPSSWTFWFEASLYIFWNFLNFIGSFFSLIFNFFLISKLWNQIVPFLGVSFLQFFLLEYSLLNQAPRPQRGRQAAEWPAGCSLFSNCTVCVCLCWHQEFWYPLIKLQIMNGFQSLRCLCKHLDKTLQYIMLKFVKSKNLTKKRPCKVFENHCHCNYCQVEFNVSKQLSFGAWFIEAWPLSL